MFCQRKLRSSRLRKPVCEVFFGTDFYKMGHKFYLQTIKGTLKPQQEEKLR